MPNTLSIRSYSRQKKGHVHRFHQLVLPLRGVINIDVGTFKGKVTPGECVVVKCGETHHFAAENEARFIVADLNQLPDSILNSDTVVFLVTPPLLHFLNFIEAQLKYRVNKSIEALMFEMFYNLLSDQQLSTPLDPRIRNALAYIEAHLPDELSIAKLSNIACLSPTQFKKVFKEQTGSTATQRIATLRMERAQALLQHTDFPLQIVAESVGYTDFTAFSRRFKQHFGLPPSKFSR